MGPAMPDRSLVIVRVIITSCCNLTARFWQQQLERPETLGAALKRKMSRENPRQRS